MHFVPRAEFATVLDVDHVDPTAVGLTRVSFAPGRRGEITGGIVVVASDDDQVTRNRTIAHELGHAMGLQHSTCASSLMDGSSDGERSVRWSPSALDIRMGSLLYDPRLAPGLGRAAVEATPHADRGRRRRLRAGGPRAGPGRGHRAPLLLRPVGGAGPALHEQRRAPSPAPDREPRRLDRRRDASAPVRRTERRTAGAPEARFGRVPEFPLRQ